MCMWQRLADAGNKKLRSISMCVANVTLSSLANSGWLILPAG